MRNLLFLLLIGLAVYGGYTTWNNQHGPAQPASVEEDDATPAPEPTSVAKTEPTPVPEIPKPEAPMPVVPAKRLAPEGVFYVIHAFSVTTDDGMRGVRLGTPVKMVKDAGTTMRVTDGKQEFDARREFLTNDLDIAANASAQQSSQQAEIAAWHQKQQVLAAANQEQHAVAVAATGQRVQELKEDARAATAERAQRMAEIRAQISSAEAAKSYTPRHLTRQKHLDNQNEVIRQLQLELGRLGVAGAAFERR